MNKYILCKTEPLAYYKETNTEWINMAFTIHQVNVQITSISQLSFLKTYK